jgi:hypothetical protein
MSRHINRTASSISAWRTGIRRNNNAGEIPAPAMLEIMKAAKKLGLDITEKDLIYGREIKIKGEASGKIKKNQRRKV